MLIEIVGEDKDIIGAIIEGMTSCKRWELPELESKE